MKAGAQVVPLDHEVDPDDLIDADAARSAAQPNLEGNIKSKHVLKKSIGRTLLTTALSYFDFVSDVLLGIEFVLSDDAATRSSGYTILGIVGFALVAQAFLCVKMGADSAGTSDRGNRWKDAGATLVGAKPAIDMWRVLSTTDEHARDAAKFAQNTYRIIEGLLETLPETVVQVRVLLRTLLAGEAVSVLQIVSLAASLATFAFVLATVNMDFDTNAKERVIIPWYCGYYPSEKWRKRALLASQTAFHCGYFAGKVLAMAVLAEAWPVALGAWVAVEVVAFWAVLATVGQRWEFTFRALNTPVLNVVLNTLLGLCMLVAPVTVVRTPYAVSPHVWCGWIVWTTLGANWAMMGLALAAAPPREGGAAAAAAAASNATLAGVGVFDDAGERALVWAALGACTLLTVVGAVCAVALMEPTYRVTFWRRKTFKQWVAENYWEHFNADVAEVFKREHGFASPTLETKRFEMLVRFPRCYWPDDAVVEAFARAEFRRFVEVEFEGQKLMHVQATQSAKEYVHIRDVWEEYFAVELVSAGFVEKADARAWMARHAKRWNRDRPKWFVKWRRDGKAAGGGVPDALRDVLA